MIKVSIVEDSRGTRESLTELLGRAAHLRCVAPTPTAKMRCVKSPRKL